MVRMARLGLAMAPMLSLKVLTNSRLAPATVYERISPKSTPTGEEDGGEVVQEQPGGF